MKQTFATSLLMFAFACSVLLGSPAARAIDSVSAVRAANMWIRLTDPGDAHDTYDRAQHIHIADLNNDKVDEVAYLSHMTCRGSNFDCPNHVVVMSTPLKPGFWPFLGYNKGDPNELRRPIVDIGYGDDASIQIPGDVETMVIVGSTIRVTFMASLDSPSCKRALYGDRGLQPIKNDCPPPGRHVWILQWKPGQLSRR